MNEATSPPSASFRVAVNAGVPAVPGLLGLPVSPPAMGDVALWATSGGSDVAPASPPWSPQAARANMPVRPSRAAVVRARVMADA